MRVFSEQNLPTSILTSFHDRHLHLAKTRSLPLALCGMGQKHSYHNTGRFGVGGVSCFTLEFHAENIGLMYVPLSTQM